MKVAGTLNIVFVLLQQAKPGPRLRLRPLPVLAPAHHVLERAHWRSKEITGTAIYIVKRALK
jgi:hypothetical protein